MGFGIKKEAGSNTTPSEIVNFDKLTPTTVGVVFDPNTPQTLDVLYVSSVNASTWIWNGTAYVTYSAPATATTEWYLNGTVIDAGSNKTAPISRNNSIYTYDYDSYFNMVRIGRGSGNVQTNTVVGDGAGYSNTTGLRNLFLGSGAGSYNTTGSYNVFAGWGAGAYNSTANSNTFIGYISGYTNTTGANNVFLGRYSGQSNTTASFNTFIGDSAGFFNTTGFANLFLGKDSGYNNTIGGANLFLGKDSGLNNTTGSNNSFLGIGSGSNNTSGSNNAFLGNGTGRFIADGVTPVTIVSNSVYLGRDIKSLADNQTNEIVIGFNAIGKGSNTVQLGNTSITNTYLNGAVTVNNAFTLPTTDGTANQVLKTNGSGVVTWGTAGSSSGIWGIANASGVYTYYATWALAVASATSGQVIELFADITESSVSYTLKNGVNINGNGHTITFSNAGNGFDDNSVSCNVIFSNINLIKTTTADTAAIKCFNASSNVTGYSASINTTIGSVFGFYGSGTIGGFYVSGVGYGILTRAGTSLNINNCYVLGYIDGNSGTTIISNTYIKGNVAGSPSMNNCTVISTSGVSYTGNNKNITNCSFVSMTSNVISGGGIFENCYIYSAAERPISADTNAQFNNCYIESATLYINQINTSGNYYNCTLKTKLSYLFYGGTQKLYNCTLINEWNTTGVFFFRDCVNNVIVNNYIQVANSGTIINYTSGTQTVYMYGNAIKGTTNINSAGITNAQTNTADAQGNVILN